MEGKKVLSVLIKKLKESLVSVLPVVAAVLILSLTPLLSLSTTEVATFAVSAIFLILGISLFNLGADLAMTPMGEHIGSGLTKLKSLTILLSVILAMGILITVAEPDLSVLAEQVKAIITPNTLIYTVGIGVGLFLVAAILKIIFRKPLSSMLMFFYMMLFALSAVLIVNGKGDLIPLSFDSGGVTTGPITVPFIMALGVGIASTIGGKDSNENSFGLIALCSVGPMLAVLVLGITSSGDMPVIQPDYELNTAFSSVMHALLHTAKSVGIALGLIVIFFAILQVVCLKLPKKKLVQIAIGIAYTFCGLVIFLTAVELGFMPIGFKIGRELAKNPVAIILIGFVLGMVTVLAEPAVHVLNKQVEEITEGTVSRGSMMIALSLGVGLSICLAMIRIVFDFSVLYYLVPGYLISLGLSFFVPGLYTAIAFDSGGVASGPLTSSFILPLAVGACCVLQGEPKILVDAFGVVALVAMAPLITIQLLGFRAILAKKIRQRVAFSKLLNADDEQIIDFM